VTIYTIGYGGRTMQDLVGLLTNAGVRSVVDVRLRPDRSNMGMFTKARTADKGIERSLRDAGLEYYSFIELGNLFMELPEWREPYEKLWESAGELLMPRLAQAPAPYCLLCAEKRPAECHRSIIATHVSRTTGDEVVHLE
jgi:uncharacterized protein (DUF488 family)